MPLAVHSRVTRLISPIVPIAVGTGLLILLLRYAPSGAPRTRDIWPAALVGSILLLSLIHI